MSPHSPPPDWNPKSGSEPTVRIGVILEADHRETVLIQLPEGAYGLSADVEGSGHPGLSEALRPTAGESVRISRRGPDSLRVQIGQRPATTAERVILKPKPSADAGQAEPAPPAGLRVQAVPAGRGFHWQKCVDQSLPGIVEVLPAARGLVLVNVLPLETYLAGVITAEMSPACPAELLKALAVAARSWLLAMHEAKHVSEPFDRCNDDCCQRYQGLDNLTPESWAALSPTRGEVLLNPEGAILDANYAKCCGGITEEPRHVWGMDKSGISAVVDAPPTGPETRYFPVTEENVREYILGDWTRKAQAYCSPQRVPPTDVGRYLGRVDESDNYFRWQVRYDASELAALLRDKIPNAHRLTEVQTLQVLDRGVSGRISKLEIMGTREDGEALRILLENEYTIRQALHRKFLYSSAFVVEHERDETGRLRAVTLYGAGWGHGVGLCQIGAVGMALAGHDYRTILGHYYPEARLGKVY